MMLFLALLGVITLQLVTSYVHHVELRSTVCQLPDGSTRTVGEKFTIGDSNCIKYECLQDGTAPYYYAGCEKTNGDCVKVNTTYNDGCSIRTCRLTEGKLSFIGTGCSDPESGACKDIGDVWTVHRASTFQPEYGHCITKHCQKDGSTNISKTDCMFNDTCFGVGNFTMNPETCEKIECLYDAAESNYIMVPTIACRAENHGSSWCVDIGSQGFPKIIREVLYEDCMCSKRDNGVSYQCFSVEG